MSVCLCVCVCECVCPRVWDIDQYYKWCTSAEGLRPWETASDPSTHKPANQSNCIIQAVDKSLYVEQHAELSLSLSLSLSHNITLSLSISLCLSVSLSHTITISLSFFSHTITLTHSLTNILTGQLHLKCRIEQRYLLFLGSDWVSHVLIIGSPNILSPNTVTHIHVFTIVETKL